MITWDLNTISAKIFAPIIIILGSIGNLLGLIIISNNKLSRMGPHNVFICMFAFDCIYLPLIFYPYLANAFQINIPAMSNWGCKLYWYARYSMAIISPMMNVYISVERYITIKFSRRILFFLKKKIQIIYILGIVLVNLAFAVQVAIGFEVKKTIVQQSNRNNQSARVTYFCDFVGMYWQDVIGYIDMVTFKR